MLIDVSQAVMIIITALLQIYIDWFRFKKDTIMYAQSSRGDAVLSAKNGVGRVTTTASDEDAIAGPEHGNTSGFHLRAFDHPALWKKQPTIWIAQDPLGVGLFESERINAASVESSTEFAHMDEKANITVERSPPDEAWYGGFTQ